MTDYYSNWDFESDQWVQRLETNSGLLPTQYLLKNPGDSLVAEQLHCYPKAKTKFPNWHKNGLVYTKLSFEQSSGEFAAIYKASLVSGNELWDLTGGLGMDSFAFSKIAASVHHNEPNTALSRIARQNHSILGATNIFYHDKLAEEIISEIQYTDTIYLDPSRRSENGRTFLLNDCVPDVTQLLPELKSKAKRVIVKLSPIYDLRRIQTDLPGTRQIHVISVSGEVREILALIDESIPEVTMAVVLPDGLKISRERVPQKTLISQHSIPPNSYLHVADPAIYKSETLNAFSISRDLLRWGTGGYLFSGTPLENAGKSYKVKETITFKPKELKKRFKGHKINIHKRNFPIDVQVLYKSLSTSMGDDFHAFFTTLDDGTKAVCITEPPVTL
jgi:hypothetical protein